MKQLAYLTCALLLFSGKAFGHSECNGKVQQAAPLTAASLVDPAIITIQGPREGEVIRSRTFNLLYSLSGDLTGDHVDHIHWQLNNGPAPTAPDLSGIDVVSVEQDGDYTLTTYMADVTHAVINEKKMVHFKVVTAGVVMLAPENGQKIDSCDVLVQYSIYGDIPENYDHVGYSVDGGPELSDADADGKIPLNLAVGAHNIQVRMLSADGVQVRDPVVRSVVVNTPLIPENGALALQSFNRAKKARTAAAEKKALKSVKSILTLMKSGGSRNPSYPNLTLDNIKKALSLEQKLSKGVSVAQNRRKLANLLKNMAKS